MSARASQDLPRRYEGQGALAELLAVAGSPMSVDDVKSLFQEAAAEQESPGNVIPDLFEGEPHFPSPDVARRLYSNLFGLWDRVARGELGEPGPGVPKPEKPAPLPKPPRAEGPILAPDLVEASFRYLTSLPEGERQRLRDRFDQVQTDLIDALMELGLAERSTELGLDLAFELWAIAETALGDRVGHPGFAELRSAALDAGHQPALVGYLVEWLDEAALDEEEPLPAPERAQLEALLKRAIAQLAPSRAGGPEAPRG